MEIEKYEALLCALEKGSLSAAAETLGYSPSGISRMMEALEQELGFRLLTRGRGGVCATPECESLLPAIRELLHHAGILREQIQAVSGLETGRVIIGSAYSAFYPALADCIRNFHQKHPGILIHLCSGSSSELLEQLSNRNIDLALISKRKGAHHWTPLCQDRLMVWIPEELTARYLKDNDSAIPASIVELESYIDIYPGQESDNSLYFNRLHLHPNTVYTTTDSLTALKMTEAGLGIALNNELNSPKTDCYHTRILPLDPAENVEIGLACSADASAAAKAFARELADFLRTT